MVIGLEVRSEERESEKIEGIIIILTSWLSCFLVIRKRNIFFNLTRLNSDQSHCKSRGQCFIINNNMKEVKWPLLHKLATTARVATAASINRALSMRHLLRATECIPRWSFTREKLVWEAYHHWFQTVVDRKNSMSQLIPPRYYDAWHLQLSRAVQDRIM